MNILNIIHIKIKYILEKNNFKLLDVELNNTNAGSIRVVASKNKII